MNSEHLFRIPQDLATYGDPVDRALEVSSTDSSDHHMKLLDKLRPSFRCLLLHVAFAILLTSRILTLLVMHLFIKIVKRSTFAISWSRMRWWFDELAVRTLHFLDIGSEQQFQRRYKDMKNRLKSTTKALHVLWKLAQFIANNPNILVHQVRLSHQDGRGCAYHIPIPSPMECTEEETATNSPADKSSSGDIAVISKQRLDFPLPKFQANPQASVSSKSQLFRCVSDNQLDRGMLRYRDTPPTSTDNAEMIQNEGVIPLDYHKQNQGVGEAFIARETELDYISGRSSNNATREWMNDSSTSIRSSSSAHFKSKSVQMDQKPPIVRVQRCSVYERRCRDSSDSPTEGPNISRCKSGIPMVERRPAMKKTIAGATLKPLKLQRVAR